MGYMQGDTVPELREIDRRAYDYIFQVWRETGFTPTSSEIAERFDIGRGGSTNKVFTALEAHGMILFNESRKSYIPTDWRSLVISELTESLGYANIEDVPFASELSELRRIKAGKDAEIDRARELQRNRAKKFRENMKSKQKV